ncbi:DUF4875 domain-containing protein [Shewanella sp. SW32]|uniref:DUF4875 domain-containing protein n=1 Tax=unclassified Shewanella TaxID=196818 RepID=UPI0021D9ECA9|nr:MULTISPECIES: DUF4875 domain-containing protein [unclassified Shewanella]MCU7964078.1 DUF4875 domain-containing protein [Shewanella sp. SW32]MCU7971983.1 DUF4875 domain-containing protein [Shewanella sp. SW29]MCU8062839.1 DUF4875 domain-containing protein [Shewanella sp. SM55]
MDTVLALLFLASSTICVIGLLNPSWAGKATRGQVFKFYGLGAIVFLFLFAVFMEPAKPSPGAATVQAEQLPVVNAPIEQAPATTVPAEQALTATKPVAHPYEVISEEDNSWQDRKRLRWGIVAPTAVTQLDRAETAKAAAKDLQEQTGADYVRVILEVAPFAANRGQGVAMVKYAPDGCDITGNDCNGKKWEVEASHVQLTDEQLAFWKAWLDNRERFDEDGLLNEDRLKAFLATKFGTTPDKIVIPFIYRENIAQ